MAASNSWAGGLYRRLLGAGWERLAPPVRRAHADGMILTAAGEFRVRLGGGRCPCLLAAVAGLPAPGAAVPVRLVVTPRGEGEEWARSIGGRPLVSVQRGGRGGLLAERAGFLEVSFRLEAVGGALRYHQQGAALCLGPLRLPLPACLAPRVRGREWPAADGVATRIRVAVALPLLGPLIVYGGTLRRED